MTRAVSQDPKPRKGSRKKSRTPRSMVKNALRRLWAFSRERREALKREHYTCQDCHRKQSKAKGKEFAVEVHHHDGINWDGLVDLILERLLQDPSRLEVLCPACHDAREQRHAPPDGS